MSCKRHGAQYVYQRRVYLSNKIAWWIPVRVAQGLLVLIHGEGRYVERIPKFLTVKPDVT